MKPSTRIVTLKGGDTVHEAVAQGGGETIYVGRYDTAEQASAAADHYCKTGMKLEDGRHSCRGGKKQNKTTYSIVERVVKERTCWEATVRNADGTRQFVGRHYSREGAQAAVDDYIATGRVWRSERRRLAHPGRYGIIVEKKLSSERTRFHVRGRPKSGTAWVHVGVFDTRPEAETAKAAYEESGATFLGNKPQRAPMPKLGSRRPKVFPNVASLPKGYNLRDHEIDPDKLPKQPIDPRMQQPGESRADWMRRLYKAAA